MEIVIKFFFLESFIIMFLKFMLIFWCGFNIFIFFFEKLSLELFGD